MRDRKWAEEKAEELVSRMTVEEKASQLRYDAPAIPRLGVPEYNWWNESIHGVARAGTATVFPQTIAFGAIFDEGFIERIADTVSTEGRAKYNEARRHGDRDIYKGLTFWAPNINIFRDPRWGRGQETYGEDPYLTSRLGCAFVRGLQGDGKQLKAAACAKHFAVHSGPEDLRHEFNAVATRKDMAETYLPAFRALVEEAGVEAVMGAYNRTNGEPCCGSPALQSILRGKWGFQGHFVSDCWAIRDFHEHHKVTRNAMESAALALRNGCDVNCGCTYQSLMPALRKGLISEEDLTRSCVRLFTTRFLLGMFGETEWDGLGQKDVDTPENAELATEAARKSIVMLKNDGVLPLKGISSIGVIGPNADSRIALAGNYHGTASRYITPLEGIEDEAWKRGITVRYSLGCTLSSLKDEDLAHEDDRLSEALAVAESSDVVVLVLGLDETLEGEQHDMGNSGWGADKTSLRLPGLQQKLMEAVIATGKPTVVIIEAGSAVDLNYASEHASAILDAWYPGARGGKAIADILFGECSPSGKLPITFYRTLDGMPEYTDYTMRNRTYRYADDSQVLYPFGFGLSYGTPSVERAEVSDEGGRIIVRATVSADADMENVLQVYVKDLDSPYAVKNHSLSAFRRLSLRKGEKQEVELEVDRKALLSVDDEGEEKLMGRRYIFSVGFSQPDSISKALMNTSPVSVEYTV